MLSAFETCFWSEKKSILQVSDTIHGQKLMGQNFAKDVQYTGKVPHIIKIRQAITKLNVADLFHSHIIFRHNPQAHRCVCPSVAQRKTGSCSCSHSRTAIFTSSLLWNLWPPKCFFSNMNYTQALFQEWNSAPISHCTSRSRFELQWNLWNLCQDVKKLVNLLRDYVEKQWHLVEQIIFANFVITLICMSYGTLPIEHINQQPSLHTHTHTHIQAQTLPSARIFHSTYKSLHAGRHTFHCFNQSAALQHL